MAFSGTLLVLIFSWCATGFSAELLLFAGAGLRQPTDLLIERFKKETGNTVRVTYAGSGQLMSSVLASGQGDLFMPGALFYIEKLKKMGRVDSFKRVAIHPRDVYISPYPPPGPQVNRFRGRIGEVRHVGGMAHVELTVGGHHLHAEMTTEQA